VSVQATASPAPAQQEAEPRPVLLHCPGADLGVLAGVVEGEGLQLGEVDSWDDLQPPGVPTVILLDSALADTAPDLHAVLRHVPEAMVVLASNPAVERAAAGADRVVAVLPADPADAAVTLRMAFRLSAARLAGARMERELARTRSELRELSAVGMALMTERDPDRLLEKIVAKARQLTGSDAGSLYLAEHDEAGTPRLRFNLAQNDTIPDTPFVSFTLPIDTTSAAGYAAVTGQTLRVEDAYDLPPEAP
jgi:hypothetical protein